MRNRMRPGSCLIPLLRGALVMTLLMVPGRLLAVAEPNAINELHPRSATNLSTALLMALAYLLIPTLIGATLGWLLRKLRRGRIRSRIMLAGACCLPLLVPLALPSAVLAMGIWDMMLLLGLLVAGFIVTGHSVAKRAGWGEVALMVVSVLVSASLVEVGYRVVGGGAPRYMPGLPSEQGLLMDPGWLSQSDGTEKAQLPFPSMYPSMMEYRLQDVKERPKRVLHVGDSMTVGVPLPPPLTYVGLLDQRDTMASHINGGMSGTGPDYQHLLVSNWVKVLKVDAVVVHFAGFGDVLDIDQTYHFCNNGQIQNYVRGRVGFNCDEPTQELTYASRFVYSPPPLLFRVLAGPFVSAQAICAAMGRSRLGVVASGQESERALEHAIMTFEALDQTLAEQGIALRLVLLPARSDLEAMLEASHHNSPVARIREKVRTAGLEILDPQPAFLQALLDSPDDEWFRNDVPGDGHFDVAGHALMADWLWSNLEFEWQPRDAPADPVPENLGGDT